MREYRGKCIDTGRWIKGDNVNIGKRCWVVKNPECIESDDMTDLCCTIYGFYEVIPESVGQFTGLKDKNGKASCKDDLYWLGEENWYQMVWLDKMACFALWPVGDESLQPIYGTDLANTIATNEISGNIHENKDLLE